MDHVLAGLTTRGSAREGLLDEAGHVVGVQVEMDASRAVGESLHLEVRVAIARQERL